MTRHWLWLLLLIAPLVLGPARAQQKPAPPPPASQATQPAISPEQARAALETLNDPKKRAAFTATLEALVRAQPVPLPPPASADPAGHDAKPPEARPTVEGVAIPLAPDSLGAEVLLTAASFLSDLGDDAMRGFQAVQSFPLLWGWIVVMVTNPMGQRLLAEAGWRLAVALILAVGVHLALRHLVRRPLARLLALGRHHETFGTRETAAGETEVGDTEVGDTGAGDTGAGGTGAGGTGAGEAEDAMARAERGAIEAEPRRRIGRDISRGLRLGLARFALEMVPVLGLLITGHMVAASNLGGKVDSRLIILAVIEAIAASLTLLALTKLLFWPEPPGLKLFDLRPSVGMYLALWARRLILIGVPGYAIGEVGLLLGLSTPAHDALQKIVGLALMVCVGIVIVRRRRRVRVWLSAPADATGVLAVSRNWLARQCYWVALFFLAATWLSWALRAPDAIARTLWYFAATAAVLAAAALARMVVGALIGRIQTAPAEASDHSVRRRLGAYHPAIRRLARLTIDVLALLGLLQLYGLGGLTWLLTTDVGHRVISGLGTLAVTIVIAFAVWEGANIAIQTHLAALRREAQAARSARLRTLLPLLRTALAIAIIVVAGLMVLSEIGLNIAPLLAGAGIVGVAIGFGSQKLVQDVITGVFLLLENTMQVGDVVKVGDQAGVVESLSVRTIRLRTEDGSVVVIPFSAVTTVTNMTRDYSRAVISVSVGYGEDVDKVIEMLRQITREMRQEDAWKSIILDDLEMYGLDSFADSALIIKCRIMCTPFGRWSVGREINRRIKRRFEAAGIEIPFPHMKLVLDSHAALPAPGTTISVG